MSDTSNLTPEQRSLIEKAVEALDRLRASIEGSMFDRPKAPCEELEGLLRQSTLPEDDDTYTRIIKQYPIPERGQQPTPADDDGIKAGMTPEEVFNIVTCNGQREMTLQLFKNALNHLSSHNDQLEYLRLKKMFEGDGRSH